MSLNWVAILCLAGLILANPPVRGAGPEALIPGVALADHASSVKDWTVASGAMTVHFEEGQAAYLLVGGAPAGVYVKGKGSFRFLAKDPVMRPTLLFNLSENTGLAARPEGDALALGEPVTEAVFWFAGRELPQLAEPELPSLARDHAALAAVFEEREQLGWVRAPDVLRRPPVGQLLAYRRLNALTEPLVTAELVGATERFVYTSDPAFAKVESLFIQRPSVARGSVPTIVLASNALGWARTAPPDPDFRLAHLDLDLVASQGTAATMKVTETLQVIRPSLRCLVFHFTHLRRTTGSGDRALAKTVVHHVRNGDGKDLRFDVHGAYLLVDLGRTAHNGETFKLAFEIDGDFLDNESQGSYGYWRLTPGSHWFPEPELAGQSYTVKVKVAVDKPFVPIASARTVARSSTETRNVLEAALDKPTLWFSVAAGKYESMEVVRNNRTVRAWCYSGIPKSAEQLLKTTHSILEFYDTILGGVPFDEINLVEVPSLGFGQSPAGMIWLTKEAFNPMEDLSTRIVAGYGAVGGWGNRLVAHELAHQYWGHRVKPFSQADNWLSESFAEYTSALAIRAMKKKGPGVYDDIVADWKASAATAAPHGTISTVQFLQPGFLDRDRVKARYHHALLYNKGAYLLACLHRDLGDTAFYAFLRGYQKRFAWYPPSITQDVPDLVKAITGRDISRWMEDNFWGTGMPR